jgi:hypothetical protein
VRHWVQALQLLNSPGADQRFSGQWKIWLVVAKDVINNVSFIGGQIVWVALAPEAFSTGKLRTILK